MSYRNPTIVNDTSGSVLGQAIAQGAQNLAKGVIGMEKANQVAKEKERIRLKKDKADAAKLNAEIIADADKANKDQQAQAANIARYAQNVDVSATQYYTEVAKEVDVLKNENRLNPTPENRKALIDANKKVANFNTLIVNTGAMQKQAVEHQKLGEATLNGNVIYTSINGDDGENSRLIMKGMKAANGWGYRLSAGTGASGGDELVIMGPTEKGGSRKETRFDHATIQSSGALWELKKHSLVQDIQDGSKNAMTMTVNGKQTLNTTMLATKDIEGGIKNQNGVMPQESIMENQPTGRVNDAGYIINESRLDTNLVNAQLLGQQDKTLSAIQSFETNSKRKNFLMDINISSEEYENGDAAKKKALVFDGVKDIFVKTYNLKEREGEYFQESNGKKVDTTVSEKETKFNEVYKKYSEGLSAIKDITGKTEKVQAIIKLASLGEGASIARGSSRRYVGDLNLTDDYVVQFGEETTKDKRAGYNLKTLSGAENFLRNKTGIEDQGQLDKLVAALQAAITE
jgi:hypothetical protein